MLNFLFRHKKNTNIVIYEEHEKFREQFFLKLQKKLINSYVKDIETKKTYIHFDASLARFAWNGWNLFNPVSKGELHINLKKDVPKLSYKLWFNEFFFIACALSLSTITAFVLGLNIYGIAVLAIIWLGFYLGSRIITVVRFNSFIEDTIFELNYPDKKLFDFAEYIQEDIDFVEKVFIKNN